jgi:transcriptional regulator with XRE-family HTH domain
MRAHEGAQIPKNRINNQIVAFMEYDPRKLFGQHLARLRKTLGWSQEKLALESGLARSYVSGIERGVRNVALCNICLLPPTLQGDAGLFLSPISARIACRSCWFPYPDNATTFPA